MEFGPLSPPKKPTFWMKHFWKKVKKVDPLFRKCFIQKVGFLWGLRGPNSISFFLGCKIILKNSNFGEGIFLIGIGRKKLWPLSLFCWFLIGRECYQKFSYIIIIVNPSAFRNGMTLENRVKIEGAMSKNMSLKLQKP